MRCYWLTLHQASSGVVSGVRNPSHAPKSRILFRKWQLLYHEGVNAPVVLPMQPRYPLRSLPLDSCIRHIVGMLLSLNDPGANAPVLASNVSSLTRTNESSTVIKACKPSSESSSYLRTVPQMTCENPTSTRVTRVRAHRSLVSLAKRSRLTSPRLAEIMHLHAASCTPTCHL